MPRATCASCSAPRRLAIGRAEPVTRALATPVTVAPPRHWRSGDLNRAEGEKVRRPAPSMAPLLAPQEETLHACDPAGRRCVRDAHRHRRRPLEHDRADPPGHEHQRAASHDGLSSQSQLVLLQACRTSLPAAHLLCAKRTDGSGQIRLAADHLRRLISAPVDVRHRDRHNRASLSRRASGVPRP
jgi:hypothetical protein